MLTLKDKIIELLKVDDGFTDREITDKIMGHGKPQQNVNIACRDMESRGLIQRVKRSDGKIGNYLSDFKIKNIHESHFRERPKDGISEDEIKDIIHNDLISKGWKTQVAWAKTPGIDIDAYRGKERWIIEVKGCGSRNAMRVNYFLAILGETLQRMSDPNAKYSIALPDLQQYRNLWERLPGLAKERTGITALFVNEISEIEEVK
ncbi:MarR family transcriptional regulator [Neobacillus sp. NPDC093127]|uniref:MarR family transcriptional regulator n=1 Tax=Neobacillus sp. NPDC093127 TaxID=3364296 RepID=UPI003805284B